MQANDSNLKQTIKDPENPESKKSILNRLLNAFHTLLGIKSKCKLLTLYKVPEDIGETIELCVFCIESKGFDLSKQAKCLLKKKWMQIEEEDESSDFTIRSGEEIGLEFRGDVKPMEGENLVIKFLKYGSSFAHVKLCHVENKDPKGYILMIRKENLIDWKRLNWGYLVKKYEGKLYEKCIWTCMRYLEKRLYFCKMCYYVPKLILIFELFRVLITSNQNKHEWNHNPQAIRDFKILMFWFWFFFKYRSLIFIFRVFFYTMFSFKIGLKINFVKKDLFSLTFKILLLMNYQKLQILK